MKTKFFILVGGLIVWLSLCSIINAQLIKNEPFWPIPYHEGDVTLNGLSDEPVWKDIVPLTEFKFHWTPEIPLPKTSLRLFHDAVKLYFVYEVEDPDIVLVDPIKCEFDIAGQDRVEFVIDTGTSMKEYYACEMDLKGRVLDFKAAFFRKFDFDWNFKTLRTSGTLTKTGYIVEGSFDLSELRDLNLLKPDGTIRIGFFRSEFSHGSHGKTIERWISWIHSGTPEAEFHVPSALGNARLLSKSGSISCDRSK